MEAQKHMIASQPIPNFTKGGVVPGGLAIVGENNMKEIIVCPSHTKI
jgi:hypothetical protein